MTTVLLRPMSRSKDSRVFYRRFDRQRPRRTVPRRRTCGGSYIISAFPTILKMTHPVHTMRRTKKQSTLSRRTNPSYRSLLLCPSSVRPNQHILAPVIENILKPSTKRQVPSLQVLAVEIVLRLHRLLADIVKTRTLMATQTMVPWLIQSEMRPRLSTGLPKLSRLGSSHNFLIVPKASISGSSERSSVTRPWNLKSLNFEPGQSPIEQTSI